MCLKVLILLLGKMSRNEWVNMCVCVCTHIHSKLYADGNQDLAHSPLGPHLRGQVDWLAVFCSDLEHGAGFFFCKCFL